MVFAVYKNTLRQQKREISSVFLKRIATTRCATLWDVKEMDKVQVGDIAVGVSVYNGKYNFIDWSAYQIGEDDFHEVTIADDISPYISNAVEKCHVTEDYIAVTRKVIKSLRGGYNTFRAASKNTRRDFIKETALAHHNNRMVLVRLSQGGA